MNQILLMAGITCLSAASFTLVGRARNSASILKHGLASALSALVYLLVLRRVVQSFDHAELMAAYVVGNVAGSVGMHYVSMRWLE